MPQTFTELSLNIKPGAPASAVPRKWFIFVNNVLKYLKIENGRIITYGDRWTIQFFGSSAKAVWSGRIWLGGRLVFEIENPSDFINGLTDATEEKGKYIRVQLMTGAVQVTNEIIENDLREWEYYEVADEVIDDQGNKSYVLNNYTVGDIRCRIT